MVEHTIRIPQEWVDRINELKPKAQTPTHFIRDVLRKRIDNDRTRPLPDPTPHGGDRTKKGKRR